MASKKRRKKSGNADDEPVVEPTPTRSTWYLRTPQDQIDYYRQLNRDEGWGFEDADFPSVVDDSSLSEEQVLCLAVYLPDKDGVSGAQRTMVTLWNALPKLVGRHSRLLGLDLIPGPTQVRVVQGTWRPGIRWVILNTTTYAGLSADEALAKATTADVQLAGVELLSLLVLQPGWLETWATEKQLNPQLSNLRCYGTDIKSPNCAPYLVRSDDKDDDGVEEFQLFFNAYRADLGGDSYCSATFVEY